VIVLGLKDIMVMRLTFRSMCLAIMTAVLVFAMPPQFACAQKRLALVIGINDYKEVPKLEKAVGDATAIGQKLSTLGFQVTTALNLDRRQLNQALSKLYSAIEPGDTVLVHYSGHGVELQGENYLLPADVPAPTDNGSELLKSESLALNTLVETLEEKGAGVRILIIDACRDNPFGKGGKRSIGGTRGLANVAASKGTFIMYSAGAGQAALDRLGDADTDPTSVYTRVLLARLGAPGVKLRDLAASIRDDVETMGKTVGHEQRPAYYDDLPENFVLAPGAAGVTAAQTAVFVPPSVVSPAPEAAPTLGEEQAFKLAQSIETIDAWNAFLAQYPDGPYAPYAKALREKLVASAVVKEKPRSVAPQADEKPKAAKPAVADGCNRFGKVRGLDVNGDNFLSVRTGPGTGFTEVDRLYTGNGVSICGRQGKWLRVKYGGGKGWVYGKYVGG
jgi:Caspase domain/Bacterial SH3 domain